MGLWPTDLLSSIGMEWRVAALILGYLCGSVPFGLLIARAFGHGDVRKIGSGNIGATNVLRTGDKKAAALTLLLDGFKGFLPAFAACAWYGPQLGSLAAIGVRWCDASSAIL